MSLGIRTDHEDGWVILSARGDLDLGGAPPMRSAVIEALAGGTNRLRIDLTAIDVIDSTGLGVLIGALRRTLSVGGELRLQGLRSHHHDLFDLVGLDAVFAIEPALMIDSSPQ